MPFEDLFNDERGKGGIAVKVAAPEAAGFLHQTPKPFEAVALGPTRRPGNLPGEKIKRGSDAYRH